jgi:hypothetical protein
MAGWGEIDSSFRFALVELDLWFFAKSLHWRASSDGEQRHLTNAMAWAETTLGGSTSAVRRSGRQDLISSWDALKSHPERLLLHKLRNQALKERRDAAPWSATELDDGHVVLKQTLLGTAEHTPAYGTCSDILRWILESAFPVVVRAIEAGSPGPGQYDPDLPLSSQMPFPFDDPWSTRCDPEFASLVGSDS